MIPTGEVREATKIVILAADNLLATSSDQKKGREASALRRACGDIKAHAETLIATNAIARRLSDCFELARATGATLSEFNRIREVILAEDVVSLPAVLIKDGCVRFALQQMAMVIIAIEFTSRESVEAVRADINIAFDQASENAADEMAQEVYFALVSLHAAVTFHLYDTARPLPQMLNFRFTTPRPTLILSHRLYDTAARADQLRKENKVIHPAFAPREGRALAF